MSSGGDLRLGVGDLLHRPGTRRDVQRDLAMDELTVSGSTVPGASAVHLDLVVESTADPGTLTLTGAVTAPWEGTCRRCLEPIGGELEAEVHEVFARSPLDEDIWPIEADEIDLAAVARETLLLALPLAPLCSDDCRGPAPEQFPAAPEDQATADEAGDGEATRLADPRWAALDELRFDD